MAMLVDTMTPIYAGSVDGGLLLPGFEVQQEASSSGLPLECAAGSQMATGVAVGVAKPLKLGLAASSPPVTWSAHWLPQKLMRWPRARPGVLPPQITKEAGW